MFRKIFWINLGLFVIILLLSYNAYKIWSQIITQMKSPSVQIEIEQRPEIAEEEEIKSETFGPSSRMSYSPIVEKDLFRPEREEWQPPPPPEEEEVEVKQTSPYPGYPGQMQEPEMRQPTVHGIIIIGESTNKKYALMQGWTRGEQQERTRKIRLGNGEIREVPLPPVPGQVTQDKVRAYRIGEYISEAQIVDILPNKVILENEDGERSEILLRETNKLELWKPTYDDGTGQGATGQGPQGPGQIPMVPGGQPYPLPPGVPVYPYIPTYPPTPPPGYVPPGGIPAQTGPVPLPQRAPTPQQPNFPRPPGFPQRGPFPGQPFTGQIRR